MFDTVEAMGGRHALSSSAAKGIVQVVQGSSAAFRNFVPGIGLCRIVPAATSGLVVDRTALVLSVETRSGTPGQQRRSWD